MTFTLQQKRSKKRENTQIKTETMPVYDTIHKNNTLHFVKRQCDGYFGCDYEDSFQSDDKGAFDSKYARFMCVTLFCACLVIENKIASDEQGETFSIYQI